MTLATPNALLPFIGFLKPSERAELDRLLRRRRPIWRPLPGPQSEAYDSPADILFYGGAAGGGKTDLLLGLAATQHERSIVFRREYAQLAALRERGAELYGGLGRFNQEQHLWRLADGRRIEFGAVQHAGDERKFQGRPHDLIGFDELCHFSEAQFRFLAAWLRSVRPRQRRRIVAAGNPPTDAVGDWVVRYFAPWLDGGHGRPARPGELRWFATLDGRDVEQADGRPFPFKDELVQPQSRTFIRARVEDNPYLLAAGYRATLQALPEPLRSLLLQGRFDRPAQDTAWQVLPSAWIAAAMLRGKARAKPPAPLSAIGVDVARGGEDRTVLALRYGTWLAPLLVLPGSATPDGGRVAALIAERLLPGAVANVDVIGVGGSVYDHVRSAGLRARALNGAGRSRARDCLGQLGFLNKRAEWWWRLREALDPDRGSQLALPEDRELAAELAAARWTMTPRGIQVEAKDDIAARLGRSPDKADAAVYAFAEADEATVGLAEAGDLNRENPWRI